MRQLKTLKIRKIVEEMKLSKLEKRKDIKKRIRRAMKED